MKKNNTFLYFNCSPDFSKSLEQTVSDVVHSKVNSIFMVTVIHDLKLGRVSFLEHQINGCQYVQSIKTNSQTTAGTPVLPKNF